MSITLFEESGHLTIAAMDSLKDGELNSEDMILVAEHIGMCEYCADILANSFEEGQLVEASQDFSETVLNKVNFKVQNKTQFIAYSLRVTLAATLALILVFSNMFNFKSGNSNVLLSKIPDSATITKTINKSMDNFSQKINRWEIFSNEKREK